MAIDLAELMAIRHAAGYTTSESHWYIGAEDLLHQIRPLGTLNDETLTALGVLDETGYLTHLLGWPVIVHAGHGIEFRP